MKEIYLDIETTGFSTGWNEIIEVAAVAVEDGNVVGEFHEYIRPKANIPYKITELTGIDRDTVVDARSEKEVLMDFIEWVYIEQPNRLIGHNIKAFDNRFVNSRASKFKLAPLPQVELYDTLTIARRLNKSGKIEVPNCKQPTLAEYFGIEYQAHSAVSDVKALIEINRKMQELETNVGATGADFGF